jgi:hypothetical protein
MRTIRTASEDEVVAAFLRAEIDSERQADRIMDLLRSDGQSRSIIDAPDLADLEANGYRRHLLGSVRGWGRGEGMFQGFPEQVAWEFVALTREELARVRYIAWDWWLERSGRTRLPVEYARRIRAGEFPSDPESGLRDHWPIARRLREGSPLPPLIAVRDVRRPDFLVLVEGHVRLTAFFLFPEMLPEELELFLGTAEGLERWGLYL